MNERDVKLGAARHREFVAAMAKLVAARVKSGWPLWAATLDVTMEYGL